MATLWLTHTLLVCVCVCVCGGGVGVLVLVLEFGRLASSTHVGVFVCVGACKSEWGVVVLRSLLWGLGGHRVAGG